MSREKTKNMTNKLFLVLTFSFGLFVMSPATSIAQELTKEEIAAEKEEMRSILKSEKVIKRQEKLVKLMKEEPKNCGVASIDGLSEDSKQLLEETNKFNKLVPELYTRTIGETVDGITDVTVKKPTVEELTQVAKTIGDQLLAVTKVANAITDASNDISKLNPMAMGKATKALGYSKDIIGLVGPELQMNAKVISNLIALLNSANNN